MIHSEGYELLDGIAADLAARLRARIVVFDRDAAAADVAVSGAHRRVWGLLARIDELAALVTHSGVVARAHALLGPELVVQNVCAHIVGPGAPRQFLHADQQTAPLPWPRPVVVTAVWMLEPFVDGNGATRVVAGTHERCGPPPYGTLLPESAPVCGQAGQVLVMDGRVWHHAGENGSSLPRIAVLVSYAGPEVSRHPRFVEAELPAVRRRLAPLGPAAPPQ